MEMIIGGAFQGKSLYAKENYPQIQWKKGGEISEEELFQAQGVLDFQDYIRKELEKGEELQNLAEELLQKNPDVILVCQEVGYGVVPMNAFDRKYRELVGRICTKLAAGSHKVTRIVCGIGMVIKNA